MGHKYLCPHGTTVQSTRAKSQNHLNMVDVICVEQPDVEGSGW